MSQRDTAWGADKTILNTGIHMPANSGDLVLKQMRIDSGEMTEREVHKQTNTIIYVNDGAIELRSGDDFYELEEGEAHFIEAGQQHQIENLIDGVAEVLRISFPYDPDDIQVLEDPYN